MLYWICPECGHECSPAIRECPTCTAGEKAAAKPAPAPKAAPKPEPPPKPAPPVTARAEQTSTDILTLAQTFDPPESPGTGLLSTASYRNLVSSATNGSSGSVAPSSAAALADEPTV